MRRSRSTRSQMTSEERRCVGLIWPNPVASLPTRSALRVGCDQQGKAYCCDGSSSFSAGYGDRAANLTHEDCHVVGTMFRSHSCGLGGLGTELSNHSIVKCLNCPLVSSSSLLSSEQYRTDTEVNFMFDLFRRRLPKHPNGD
jgi:hypothetical protein